MQIRSPSQSFVVLRSPSQSFAQSFAQSFVFLRAVLRAVLRSLDVCQPGKAPMAYTFAGLQGLAVLRAVLCFASQHSPALGSEERRRPSLGAAAPPRSRGAEARSARQPAQRATWDACPGAWEPPPGTPAWWPGSPPPPVSLYKAAAVLPSRIRLRARTSKATRTPITSVFSLPEACYARSVSE